MFFLAALAVGAAFAALNLHWIARGVLPAGDTPRYTGGGDALFSGEGLTGRQVLYVGYIAVVGLCQTLGVGLDAVLAVQVVLSAAAAVAVWDLGRQLTGSWGGLAAAALFVLNRDIAQWNVYVLPDSLYISTLVIAVWLAVRAARRRGWWYVWASLVLVFASTLRPNGWLLVPIVVSYWVLSSGLSKRARWIAVAGVFAALFVLVLAVPSQEGTTDTLKPGQLLREGVVVYDFAGSNLAVASEPSDSDPGWGGFARYAADHPIDAGRVLVARAGTELLHTRAFYTSKHNAFVLITLLPVYAFALVGLVVRRREPLVRLLAVLIAGHIAIITIIAADYDGRYLLHFLPLVDVLAACGIAWTVVRVGNRSASPAPAQ